MAGIAIPGLAEKLRILIDDGPFTDMEEIAKAFGQKVGTIRYWAPGNGNRADNLLPGRHYPVFCSLIARSLSADVSYQRRRLMTFMGSGPHPD